MNLLHLHRSGIFTIFYLAVTTGLSLQNKSDLFMAEPTLTQVFGTGATQDSNTITIQKSALVAKGLTASANNKAEGLLIALLLVARDALTQANFDADTDNSIIVANGFSSLTTRGANNTAYRTDQLTISFSKLDAAATIDPDDY